MPLWTKRVSAFCPVVHIAGVNVTHAAGSPAIGLVKEINMRCICCDRSDQGLSMFRPDGRYHATRFSTDPHTGFDYCSECNESYSEVMEDFFDEDLIEEEQEEAFDYE